MMTTLTALFLDKSVGFLSRLAVRYFKNPKTLQSFIKLSVFH